MIKERIDKLLVARSLAPSRERAQSLVMSGCVLINDKPVTKAGQLVPSDANIRLKGTDHPYVGRGGIKLQHALCEFKIDVSAKLCIDVGASTGGFTDCLLQNGASKVYAIDVGYGQLDWKLRSDPRVVVMERTNIRDVDRLVDLHDIKFDVAVVDVSFISLEKVLPHVDKLLKNGANVVALIKPQFEVGRDKIGKGGIVTDELAREECVERICHFAQGLGWKTCGVLKSPITGADGNVEFLAWFVK